MAEQAAFQTFLLQSMGLSVNTVYILQQQGLSTLPMLARLSEDQILSTLTHINRYVGPRYMGILPPNLGLVEIPQAGIPRFLDLKYWFDFRMKTALNPSATNLTEAGPQDIAARREFVVRRKRNLQGQVPEKPPTLNTFKDWPKWWELFDNHMKQIYGDSDVNLSYVHRPHVEVTQEMHDSPDYESDDEKYYMTLALNTEGYLLDRTRVWVELKTLIVDGPGWEFIQMYEASRDGREAVLALKQQNEAESSIQMRKTSAYTALSSLLYEGPKKNWTFAHFVTAHQKHYNVLLDCGEPVPETKKVTDFISRITDPTLQAAISNVWGDQTKLSSFTECHQYLAKVAAGAKITAQTSRKRRMGKVTTDTTSSKKKPKLEAKSYPKHVWYNVFTADDRKKVDEMRKEKKAKQGERTVNSISSNPDSPDLQSIIEEQVERTIAKMQKSDASPKVRINDNDSDTKGGNAGLEFGRSAYSKKN